MTSLAFAVQDKGLTVFGPSRNDGAVAFAIPLVLDGHVDVGDGGGKRLGRFMAVDDVPQPFQRLDLAINLPPVEQACDQESRKETQDNETRCIFFNQKAGKGEDDLSRRVAEAYEV